MAEKAIIEFELQEHQLRAEIQEINKAISITKQKFAEGKISIDQATKSLYSLDKGAKNASKDLGLLNKKFAQTGQAAKQAGGLRGIGFFGQQVGYLASDARYGVLGMANNLSIIVPLFQNLQKHAKAAGKSLGKELWRSLKGPTGILIAMQLLIVLLPEIIDLFKKWGGQSDKTAASIKELEASTYSLAESIEKENKVLKESVSIRKSAIDSLTRHEKGISNLYDGQYKKAIEALSEYISAEDFANMTTTERIALLLELEKGVGNLSAEAKKAAAEVTAQETADTVFKILGMTTKVEDLEYKARNKIARIVARTGKSAAEVTETFWNSSEGLILAARIEKAKQDAIDKAAKEVASKNAKKKAFADKFEIEGNALAKINNAEKKALEKATELGVSPEVTAKVIAYYADQRTKLKEQKEKDKATFYDSFLLLTESEKIDKAQQIALDKAKELGVAPEQTDRIIAFFDDQRAKLKEKEDKLAQQKQDRIDKANEALKKGADDLLLNDREKLLAQRETEIQLLNDYYDSVEATEEERLAGINALRQKYRKYDLDDKIAKTEAALNVATRFLTAAQQADPKNKKLAKASVIANAAQAVLGTWSQWMGNPGGPLGPIGNPIAAGVQTAGIYLTAKNAVKNIDNESVGGASSGSSASASPRFNVIGGTGQNQLLDAVNRQQDRKVVLVTNELEAHQNDTKVAIEQSTIG